MKYEEYTSNGNTRTRSAAQIEADLGDIRGEMSDTIRRLEERFSPRALLDVAFSRARGLGEGSSEFAGNLGATIRDHPVPVLLMAAGVASLIASERRGPRASASQEPERFEGESKAEGITSKVRQWGDTLGERAGEAGERAGALRERAGEQAGALRERAGTLRDRAKERGGVVRDRMRGAMEHARSHGSRALHEEPLVIVGVGLALGALFGAATPISERERRAMGAKGGHLLERAKQTAEHGVERAKQITERVMDEGSTNPEEQTAQAFEMETPPPTAAWPADEALAAQRAQTTRSSAPTTRAAATQAGARRETSAQLEERPYDEPSSISDTLPEPPTHRGGPNRRPV